MTQWYKRASSRPGIRQAIATSSNPAAQATICNRADRSIGQPFTAQFRISHPTCRAMSRAETVQAAHGHESAKTGGLPNRVAATMGMRCEMRKYRPNPSHLPSNIGTGRYTLIHAMSIRRPYYETWRLIVGSVCIWSCTSRTCRCKMTVATSANQSHKANKELWEMDSVS